MKHKRSRRVVKLQDFVLKALDDVRNAQLTAKKENPRRSTT